MAVAAAGERWGRQVAGTRRKTWTFRSGGSSWQLGAEMAQRNGIWWNKQGVVTGLGVSSLLTRGLVVT